MTMTPLGWSHGRVLFALGTAGGSYLYAPRRGLVSILFPQITTGAELSPDGNSIAFAVHTNCGWCTVDLFNVQTHKVLYGPSGAPSESDLAWSQDSRFVVTISRDHLAIVDRRTGSIRLYRLPPGLPRVWRQPLRAATAGASIILLNSMTGQRYRVV